MVGVGCGRVGEPTGPLGVTLNDMSQAAPTQVVELAVNLDDATPQLVGEAQRVLMEQGALDVWTTAIGMKKGRPGVCLSLLCGQGDADRLSRRVLELTGSFGVRRRGWDRLVLDRRHETIATPIGPVRVKVGVLDGEVLVAKPEYEDVRALAESAGVTFRAAQRTAGAAAAQWLAAQERG